MQVIISFLFFALVVLAIIEAGASVMRYIWTKKLVEETAHQNDLMEQALNAGTQL